MKKIILSVISVVAAAVLLCGCSRGNGLPGVKTEDAPKAASVKQSDYNNDLEGLEKYLNALGYIPDDCKPVEMTLCSVIGAKDGDRYIFNVNGTNVAIELYEYDTDDLNEDAQRVLDEIKETGKFHVFKDKSIDGDNTYPAIISDNGKYMMIYNDPSKETQNITQKNTVEATFKSFYKDNKPFEQEESKEE